MFELPVSSQLKVVAAIWSTKCHFTEDAQVKEERKKEALEANGVAGAD